MTDAEKIEKTKEPLPHDGWGSRKTVITCVTLGLCFAGSGVAVAIDKATFAEAAGFLQWAIPTTLGLLFGGLSLDKFAQAKTMIAGLGK
jgi:hypothetical protein